MGPARRRPIVVGPYVNNSIVSVLVETGIVPCRFSVKPDLVESKSNVLF